MGSAIATAAAESLIKLSLANGLVYRARTSFSCCLASSLPKKVRFSGIFVESTAVESLSLVVSAVQEERKSANK